MINETPGQPGPKTARAPSIVAIRSVESADGPTGANRR